MASADLHLVLRSAKDVFHYFMGHWKLTRTLGIYGQAVGEASFVNHNHNPTHPLTIKYREDVQVSYGPDAHRLQGMTGGTAYQEYLYLYFPDQDKISKTFVDGRHFYDLKLDVDKLEAEGDHLCVNDFYQARYRFLDHNKFTLSYKVNGPEKDYVIQTEFVRGNPPEA